MITVTVVASAEDVYSRYDPLRDVVEVHLEWTGALGGELLTVRLVRMDGYGPVASTTIPVVAPGSGQTEVHFPLESCLDSQGIYRARSGTYTADVTDDPVLAPGRWVSPPFDIALFSIRQVRDELCKGIPLNTSDTVQVQDQPVAITGVEVVEVSEEHHRDLYPLTYVASAKTLSWNLGPPVPVDTLRWNGVVTLVSAGVRDYLRVRVKPSQLPTVDTQELLLVNRRSFDDRELLRYLTNAQHWTERKTWIRAEPTTTGTQVIADEIRAGLGNHAVTHLDRVAVAVHLERQTNLRLFTKINLPLVYVQKLHELYGYTNSSRIVTPGTDWYDVTDKNGFVELVPIQGAAIQWQFTGGFMFSTMISYPFVPNFWHYIATEGAPDLNGELAPLREVIGKKAAIEILLQAGFNWKPGYAAENIARDGVASSLAYAHGPGGVFMELIKPYQDYIDQEVRGGKLRSSLGVIKMVVL